MLLLCRAYVVSVAYPGFFFCCPESPPWTRFNFKSGGYNTGTDLHQPLKFASFGPPPPPETNSGYATAWGKCLYPANRQHKQDLTPVPLPCTLITCILCSIDAKSTYTLFYIIIINTNYLPTTPMHLAQGLPDLLRFSFPKEHKTPTYQSDTAVRSHEWRLYRPASLAQTSA